jgi:hypothetical protein
VYIRAYIGLLRPFLRSHRARTHPLTHTYPHPRLFHDVDSEAHHACRGRGLAFRLSGTRKYRSASARCGYGYGPLRRELFEGTCDRGGYRIVLVLDKVTFAPACESG